MTGYTDLFAAPSRAAIPASTVTTTPTTTMRDELEAAAPTSSTTSSMSRAEDDIAEPTRPALPGDSTYRYQLLRLRHNAVVLVNFLSLQTKH